MQHYPKWKYHRTEEPEIVANEKEEAALGLEWVDSPAHLEKVSDKADQEKPEKKKREGKTE